MLDQPQRKRKGRRLISKSDHWIEIQERTGISGKVSLRDIKKSARIRAARTSKAPMVSLQDVLGDSESSWRMKVAEARPSHQPQVSPPSSNFPTRRIQQIEGALGLVLRDEVEESVPQGAIGSLQ